ncbi:MAG: ATPase [Proteobacteria bacterium]|nr:ATPase [Pseudomonadota bacterium]
MAKRFYGAVGVAPLGDGFTVTLDGRAVRTPAGRPLTLPTEALARAVAGEWEAQEENVRPHTMPMMQLADAAIDRVEPHRQEIIEQTVAYARNDMLCYRADSPPELTDRQAASWQPLLDWAAETHRARLTVTCGVTPVGQPEAALDALGAAVEALDDLELAALADVTGASGSLIVALALAAGRIGADEAHAVSQLDESYQVEKWGEDAEAQARCRRLHADIRAAAAFLALARG